MDDLLLLALIGLAAGLVKGLGGFGSSLVAIPLLTMLLGPERIEEIIMLLNKHNFSIKRLRFVYPKKGEDSYTVLIDASNNGSTGLKLLEPLYVHEGLEYTEEIRKIFRYGKEE